MTPLGTEMTKVEGTYSFELTNDCSPLKNCMGMQFLIIQLKNFAQNFQKSL